MDKASERIGLSAGQWAISTGDSILIGRRDVVFRKISGGPEFSQFLEALQSILVDGAVTRSSLYQHVQGRFPEAFVDEALAHLLNFGIVEALPEEVQRHVLPPEAVIRPDGPGLPPTDDAAPFAYFGAEAPRRRLAAGSVAVVGVGRLADRVVAGLGEIGLGRLHRLLPDGTTGVASHGARVDSWRTEEDLAALASGFDLVIAAADDPIERLRSFPLVNRAVLQTARCPWLTAYVDGHHAFIGPLFVPDETGCYRCMELREENHLPHPTEFGIFKAAVANPIFTCALNTPAPVIAAAGAIVVSEAMKVLARFGSPATYQSLVVIDCNLLDLERHPLLKVPFCDICGTHLKRAFQKTWDI